MLTFTWTYDGELTDVVSLKLSDPNGAYGLRRSDTNEILVADGANWTRTSEGTYEYDVSSLELEDGVLYDYWIEALFDEEYTRLQRFIVGSEAVSSKVINFVCIKELQYQELTTLPVFANPTGTYGVVRLDTGATVAAVDTPFSANGLLYSASIGEPAADLDYRFYVKTSIDEKTYYVTRVYSLDSSAMLAIGRYTDSSLVETRFGFDNVAQWIAIDNGEPAADYAMRMARIIDDAEREIDLQITGGFFAGTGVGEGNDFADGIPPTIERLATELAGIMMYELRGNQSQDAQGTLAHRYKAERNRIEKTLRELRYGALRIDAGISPQATLKGYTSCVVEKIYDPTLGQPEGWGLY